MHQQRTTDETRGTTSSVLPGIAALLLVLFLRRVTAAIATLLAITLLLAVASTVSALLLAVTLLPVSALLSIATLTLVTGPGVLECAFACLLVHKEPPVVAGVPLGVPGRRDWRGTLLAVLLLPAVLLLSTVLLLPAMLALACEFIDDAIEEAHCEGVLRCKRGV